MAPHVCLANTKLPNDSSVNALKQTVHTCIKYRLSWLADNHCNYCAFMCSWHSTARWLDSVSIVLSKWWSQCWAKRSCGHGQAPACPTRRAGPPGHGHWQCCCPPDSERSAAISIVTSIYACYYSAYDEAAELTLALLLHPLNVYKCWRTHRCCKQHSYNSRRSTCKWPRSCCVKNQVWHTLPQKQKAERCWHVNKVVASGTPIAVASHAENTK